MFWLNALMLFLASRLGDVVNLVTTLWLVPKFVAPASLGAVLPLSSFATALALPIYAFALTFSREITALAAHGEEGALRSLLRGVFLGVGILLALMLALGVFVLPRFLAVVQVNEPILVPVVLGAAFLGCTAPVYRKALQGLKRFRAMSMLELLGAPVRFLVSLVLMPVQALTGYFAGVAAVPAFTILFSVSALHRALGGPAAPYWTRSRLRHFLLIFLGMAGYQLIAMALGLVEQTALRVQLPADLSAAYYLVSRVSDLTMPVTGVLLLVLFPYTAELAEQGVDTRPLMLRTAGVVAIGGILFAMAGYFWGGRFLTLFPQGGALPAQLASRYLTPLVLANVMTALMLIYTNTEASAARFGFLRWYLPLHLVLLGGFYALCRFGVMTSLSSFVLWLSVSAAVKLFSAGVDLWIKRS